MSLLERLSLLWPHVDIMQDDKLYLRRWYLGPKLFGRRVYLHKICMSDTDRDPHSHPWDWTSIILRGSYRETRYVPTRYGDNPTLLAIEYADETYFPLNVLQRNAGTIHKLELTNPVYTLVLRGKTERPWYFWTANGPVESSVYLKDKQ